MTWKIEFDNRARKELRKFDAETQSRILKWLRQTIATVDNPRRTGKALKGRLRGLWRYRVGNYRLICQIQDEHVMVLVVRVSHRGSVYED
jgi:mRNA interferase RelE/StbE